MPDTISSQKRSWNMSRIKSNNTSIENKVRKYLLDNEVHLRKNKKLPGKPDFKQDIYLIVGADDKYVTRSFIEKYFPNATHFFLDSVGHEVDKLLELALEKNLIF